MTTKRITDSPRIKNVQKNKEIKNDQYVNVDMSMVNKTF